MSASAPMSWIHPADNVPVMLAGHAFDGYRNADGSVGTRDLLAITTGVYNAWPAWSTTWRG